MLTIIRWDNPFTCKGLYCLEFEKLDISLREFLQRSQHRSLLLREIRLIVQQLATDLEFLKTVGIIHADLKPENIMMVDRLGQPLRVKVIDFGLACHDPEALMVSPFRACGTVVTSGTWGEHVEQLREVLDHLCSAGLTINPAKCV
ncbi:homeodomain-interacting protein kinase 1-like isoform X2 [Trachinotus anak]